MKPLGLTGRETHLVDMPSQGGLGYGASVQWKEIAFTKIVLSRDMEIVKFLDTLPREEFRQEFLRKVAGDMSFSFVLDDPQAGPESFQSLHDLMIENGIPEALIASDRAI